MEKYSAGIKKLLLKTSDEPENSGEPVNTEKPEIIVFLQPHASCVHCLMLCIENIGTGAAYNVQFGTGVSSPDPSITPASNFSNVEIINKNNFLQNGIGCFGPGQKIEQFVTSLIDGLPEELKQAIQVSVTYSDSLNYPYENNYVLDFSEFESLARINLIKENAPSDYGTLLDVIQLICNQVTDYIERSGLSQTAEPHDSTPLFEGSTEHRQSVESKEDNPLSRYLQQFVDLYNAGKESKLREIYSPQHSIRAINETELYQNPNIDPVFKTDTNGSFVAYALDSENLYAVVPFSGCILQKDLYNSGALGKVFECPGFDPKYTYHIKVIRPAFFKQDNDEWALREKGELELAEKDH